MEIKSEELFDGESIEKIVNKKNVYHFVKRGIDILGSFTGLIILLPVFIIVAIWIKGENRKAPIFFKQERIGKQGKKFMMFKFRSMCVDAELRLEDLLDYNEKEGPIFKMKKDPRVTSVGRFIRKTSIDELPQLLNVLKGDMSLVGPRPPLTREVELYTDYDKQRLSVIPGCTGLWQVTKRSEANFKEMVELDIQYIYRMSIKQDIVIMFKTIYIMLRPNNAY